MICGTPTPMNKPLCYVCGGCLWWLNDFMNEEIYDRVKIDLLEEVRKVLKEGK